MLLSRPTVGFLVVFAFCAGCGCGEDSEPRDSAADASRDVEPDAGSDAIADAAADADGPTDASTDAFDGAVGPAGWVPMPSPRDECVVERATNPAALYRPQWAPCEEQPIGCQREIPLHVGIRTDVGWFDGERGYTWLAGAHDAIVDLDLGTIAAWRSRESHGDDWLCGVTRIGIGDGHASVYSAYHHFSDPDRGLDRIYHAPVGSIAAETTPFAELPGWSGGTQTLAVSRSMVAAEMQPLVLVFTSEGRRALWTEEIGGVPQRVHAAGDFAFWLNFQGSVQLAWGSYEQGPDRLRDITPGRVRGFRSDGVDLAWVEIFDTPPSLTLYTARAPTDVGSFTPRAVGPIEGIQFNQMGGGWYGTIRADPERIELVELATGRTKTWFAAPGERIGGDHPVYVSANEVLLRGRRSTDRYWIRVDPRSLPFNDE